MLERTLLLCRHVYHAAVGERREAWRVRGVSVTYYQQQAELPGIKEAMPEYAEVTSQVSQDVVVRVDRAYHAFFRRVQAGETAGYPRFQGRTRSHSFTSPQGGGHGGARLENGFLVLSKVGRVAVRWSRPLEGTPKTVTICREADGWYAVLSRAEVPTQPLTPTGRETGIDVGLQVFLITADGDVVENPRHHRRGEQQLAKAQRRVSRRKQGSQRRRKAGGHRQRAHQTVQRRRADFHQQITLALLRWYDRVSLEDVRVATLGRNRHLAQSIADAGWAQFRAILDATAACAGRRVVAVPPASTSQECGGCGARVPKTVSMRTHNCPTCRLVLDWDEHAARNSQWAGQALRGLAG